jgi:hypothetical protein
MTDERNLGVGDGVQEQAAWGGQSQLGPGAVGSPLPWCVYFPAPRPLSLTCSLSSAIIPQDWA